MNLRSFVRRSGKAVVVIVVLALAFAGLFWTRYPGLVGSGWSQFRRGGTWETANIVSCLVYWSRYLGRLELNKATGGWDFPETAGGLIDFHRGDFAAAIASLDGKHRTRRESFWLAMAHLRASEQQNCLAVGTGQPRAEAPSCVLPISRFYEDRTSSKRAVELLSELLEKSGRDHDLRRWLLAFGTATAGDRSAAERILSPAGVDFLRFFDGKPGSTEPQLVFVDRAAELGVATVDAGKGVAVEDFDGDGDLDIVTGGSFDPLRFYSKLGSIEATARIGEAEELGFTDQTRRAGLDGISQAHIVTAADFDNDGWMDVFVGRLFQPPLLMRNMGEGYFQDSTAVLGFDGEDLRSLTWTWGSAWGDVDNDGDLDLFLARWSVRAPGLRGPLAGHRKDSLLLLNEGDAFRDATAEFGLASYVADGAFNDAAFGDIDGDGDADLFLSSIMHSRSALFENIGGRELVLLDRGSPGFTAAMLDVDHDGSLEIFQGGLADARTSTGNTVFGRGIGAPSSGRSRIINIGRGGRLSPITNFFGDEMPIGTMGASFGDLDNDGCLDFYLGTGGPEPWFVLPNLLYKGVLEGVDCAQRSRNITMLDGFGTIQKGHGIVFFDFDDDGDQDVYSSLGGMWPGDRWPNQLFVNESELGRSWIKIRLRGRRTNRYGVGARIWVEAVEADSGRIVSRRYHMDNKTGFGSAPFLAHIGLLHATEISWIEVFWPASGCTARYAAELDTSVVLDERVCFEPSSDEQRS